MKKYKIRHTIFGSESEFTEATAPSFLKSGPKGSTMDNQWFWDGHILPLRVGESVSTDFHEITCIDCGVSVVEANEDEVVFEVPVTGQETRYMCAKASRIPERAFVVMVDANAFFNAWMTCSQGRPADCVPREEMPLDSKYDFAVNGFAAGRENPVPLAVCQPYEEDGKDMISFDNGVTRTFWLLANNAPVFPVQVYGQERADMLHRIAGADRAPHLFVDLFPPVEQDLIMKTVTHDEHQQIHSRSEHHQG